MGASWRLDVAGEGLKRYRTNVVSDMTNCWKLWVPAQLINFSVVPVHLLVVFAASVSFVWSCVLSARRGDMHRADAAAKEAERG